MIIRHGETCAEGQALDNTFVAFDDLENELGGAEVVESMADMLCPARPHHLFVRADCQKEAFDALMGAATARAMLLARRVPDAAARIYAECAPGDEETMKSLRILGYKGGDSLIRMRKELHRGPIVRPLPAGCTIVRDYLIDETESRFFLERYNAMFAKDKNEAWLNRMKRMPDFARLLVVRGDGLAGEMLTWSEGRSGVVGVVITPPAFQGRGAGSYLMEMARLYWLEKGLTDAVFEIWTRLNGAMRLAAGSGFRPAETLMEYPGIDFG